MYSLNSVVFKSLFASKDRNYLILDNSELMQRHTEMLKADLSDLSIFLERVSDAGANLKAIFLNVDSMSGTVSDVRRRTLSSVPHRKSEVELTDPADIGIKLGASMSSAADGVEGDFAAGQVGQGLQDADQQVLLGGATNSARAGAGVFGLSVPSEEEEWVIREGGVDLLQQHQQMRFGGDDDKAEELALVRELTRKQLERCLLSLCDCFAEFVPHLVLSFPNNGNISSCSRTGEC